ncbi:uncharacterized protein FIBRA_08676 [Fibroporia radiculosa]|uniref:Uncharacterized protein n=1 Tax=Fibroporia radiculosa TaxID=599839 RepID=J4GX86_9APHY|nr:uncharacterized protein FIBRA_08676 [Fibroporia radiculosa]CCM06415.1 predicted protein [Fibroporia radiculosa]
MRLKVTYIIDIQGDGVQNCQQKPKHPNHEYCGKKCAAEAQAQSATQPKTAAWTGATRGKNLHPAGNTGQKGGLAAKIQQAAAGKFGTPQPSAPPAPGVNAAPKAYARSPPQVPGMPPSSAPSSPGNGQFGSPGNMPQGSLGAAPGPASQQSYGAPYTAPPTCKIPGCMEPVYVDSNGWITSEFCSMRHRKEAVATSLVDACIMCHEFPQNTTDYFCSRTCREAALNK